MDEYNSVVAKYNQLCESRNDSSFWAENITEATEAVTSRIVWQNFYAYMANSQHVFTDQWQSSLGEELDKGLTLGPSDVTFNTQTVENGNVTYIRMTPDTNENLIPMNKHGKQVVRFSETISEEASGDESKTSDEKCQR